MIEFYDVTKVYNNTSVALKNLTLKIEDGEFVFVVGPSGSGKSTFLKLMMKGEEPTKGKIIINGTDITKMRDSEVPYLRRTMGIVFQDFKLIDKMTVYENVEFAMDAVGASSKEKKDRVPYVLGLVGLSSKSKRRPSELSGGEQQRVGLARALVNNPYMILADEPTGNIDPAMSYEIVELLGKINQCGTTIVMVTHDLSIVEKFDFRLIEIADGVLTHDSGKRVKA